MDEPQDHLHDDVCVLKSSIVAEQLRNAQLEHLIALLQRMQFGRRSKKIAPDQLALVLEDSAIGYAEANALVAQSEDAAAPQTRKRRDPDTPRVSPPAHRPRVEVEIMPEVSECPCRGGALHRIGEDRAERLGAMPRAGDGAAQAGLPGLQRRGCAGAGAEVLVKKYADHLPLYRQSQIMARHGVILDRATLANWVGAAAARLKPLVELMKAELLTSARLFVDETTAKVLAPGTGKTKVGYTWAAKLLGDYSRYPAGRWL
jgi:transposase